MLLQRRVEPGAVHEAALYAQLAEALFAHVFGQGVDLRPGEDALLKQSLAQTLVGGLAPRSFERGLVDEEHTLVLTKDVELAPPVCGGDKVEDLHDGHARQQLAGHQNALIALAFLSQEEEPR